MPTFRAAEQFETGDVGYPAGTIVVSPSEQARAALRQGAEKTG